MSLWRRQRWTQEVRFRTGPLEDRLRILVFLARLPKKNVDGSWIVFNLLRRLGEWHDLTVVSFIDFDWERDAAKDLEPYCRELQLVLRRPNYDRLNLHGLTPREMAYDFADPGMVETIQTALTSGEFDLVHVEYLEMAQMLPNLRQAPSLFTYHEVMTLVAQRESAKTLFEKVRRWNDAVTYQRFELDVCRRFNQVVALSSFDAEFLHRYDPRLPLTTIPSGVHLDSLPEPDPGKEEPIVAMVGYYIHPPNVDGARWLSKEIFPRVRERVPNARCMLIGKEPTEELHQFAREDPAIEVTGFVEDLRDLMERVAVIVVPIRTGAGLRGKILEAWSAKKAVVTTTIGAQGFEAVDGEHYLMADTPQSMSEAIVELLENRERRRELGARGYDILEERYSDTAMARAYESLYKRALSARIEGRAT